MNDETCARRNVFPIEKSTMKSTKTNIAKDTLTDSKKASNDEHCMMVQEVWKRVRRMSKWM